MIALTTLNQMVFKLMLEKPVVALGTIQPITL